MLKSIPTRSPITCARQRPSVTLTRPRHKAHHITVRRNAIDNSWVETSYFVGKYITLFTFFYTGLNYLTYRDVRKKMESEEDEE